MKIAPIISLRIKAATRGRIQISTVVVIPASVVKRVRYEDSTSEIIHTEHGVPQGSFECPILYTIYVDELINEISNTV